MRLVYGNLQRSNLKPQRSTLVGAKKPSFERTAPVLAAVLSAFSQPTTYQNPLIPMAAMWYYKNGENVTGPYEPAQIKQAVNQGVITTATQVRQGENGTWFSASQVPGLLTPPNFGGETNVSQMTDRAYRATKNFAEDSTWKTGLFRFAQLLVVAFEIVFMLYGIYCLMTTPPAPPISVSPAAMLETMFNTMPHAIAVAFFQTRLGIAALFASLVCAALAIAVLEIAVSTSKMADYLRNG